jgi:hypothetical protein
VASPSVAAGTVAALTTLLPFVALVGAAVWVYEDARDRGRRSPLLLAVATVALPFFLPGYLLWLALGRLGARSSPPDRRERTAGTLGFGTLLAYLVGALFGPPDPVTQSVYALAALVPALAVAYVLTGRVGPAHDGTPAGG